MKLTEEQLKQIDNYIQVSGIKYYDVRMEIVDHFANILEERLDENPDLDFRQELENIHKGFSNAGFSKLLKEKTKAVTKKFFLQSTKHLITFFEVPKIVITIFLLFSLNYLIQFFENKETFFSILLGVSLILSASIFIKPLWKDSTKEKFLS